MFLLRPRIFLMLLFRCFILLETPNTFFPEFLSLFFFFFLRVSCQFLNTGFSCCQGIALICRWELMRCSFLSAELCQEFRVRLWWIRKSGKENSTLDFPKQNLFPLSENKMPRTFILWFGGIKVNEGKRNTIWWNFFLFYLWSSSWEISLNTSLHATSSCIIRGAGKEGSGSTQG